MANQWLRLWHDMPNDPKWRTIARASKQPIALVQAVYLHLLVSASENDPRGTIRINREDVASALDADDASIECVLEAMQGRVLNGDQLSGWVERQPVREDGAEGGKTPSSNYVYYLGTTDSDVVKVGISRNPWSRVRDLQTGSSSEFVLFATMKTETRTEFAIHEFFKSTRTKGEWFKRSNALNSLIDKTKAGDFQSLDDCIAFLNELPAHDYVATTANYGRKVVTTKDKDKEEIKKVEPTVLVDDKSSTPADPIQIDRVDCPMQAIADAWNAVAVSMAEVKPVAEWADARKRMVKARWVDKLKLKKYTDKPSGIDYWTRLFARVEASDFLAGRGGGTFAATLDWVMNPTNLAKIIENGYPNRQAVTA